MCARCRGDIGARHAAGDARVSPVSPVYLPYISPASPEPNPNPNPSPATLQATHGRAPTDEELAAHLGVEVKG